MHNPFTCKDYFQEILKVETTKESMDIPIYGLEWKYAGILENIDTIRIASYESSTYNNSGLKISLVDKTDIIVKILNILEKNLKFKNLTVIEECNIISNRVKQEGTILNIPIEWTKYPYLFSFYLTLYRAIIELDIVKFKDYKLETLINELFDNSKPIVTDCSFLIKGTKNLFILLYNGKILKPEKTYKDFTYTTNSIHSQSGISNTLQYQTKFKEEIDATVSKIQDKNKGSEKLQTTSKDKTSKSRRVKKKPSTITI